VNESLSNITIKRVTLQPRNPNNAASPDETKILEELAKHKSKNLKTVQVSPTHYKVYKPIYMMKKCLSCHGDDATRNKEANAVIQAKYKTDKALNYKEGDFRGAFVADINLSK
jgi:nitrate reductase cytochrome c-type subunit